MALEQSLNLTCTIRSNSKSKLKRPYLGNETTNLISAGANILLSSRAFTYSFMKVALRHSFTLFRPLSVRKTTFFGVFQVAVTGCHWSEYAPGPVFQVGKKLFCGNPPKNFTAKFCDLFRWGIFTYFHSARLKTHYILPQLPPMGRKGWGSLGRMSLA